MYIIKGSNLPLLEHRIQPSELILINSFFITLPLLFYRFCSTGSRWQLEMANVFTIMQFTGQGESWVKQTISLRIFMLVWDFLATLILSHPIVQFKRISGFASVWIMGVQKVKKVTQKKTLSNGSLSSASCLATAPYVFQITLFGNSTICIPDHSIWQQHHIYSISLYSATAP